MIKFTLKQLKQMAQLKIAEDVTYITAEAKKDIDKVEKWYKLVGYAQSKTYGNVGQLYQGASTNKLYVITSNTNARYLFDM